MIITDSEIIARFILIISGEIIAKRILKIVLLISKKDF
jgi:hypothetical protein